MLKQEKVRNVLIAGLIISAFVLSGSMVFGAPLIYSALNGILKALGSSSIVSNAISLSTAIALPIIPFTSLWCCYYINNICKKNDSGKENIYIKNKSINNDYLLDIEMGDCKNNLNNEPIIFPNSMVTYHYDNSNKNNKDEFVEVDLKDKPKNKSYYSTRVLC